MSILAGPTFDALPSTNVDKQCVRGNPEATDYNGSGTDGRAAVTEDMTRGSFHVVFPALQRQLRRLPGTCW